MEYSNPKIPEGINASEEHPLKEFAVLTAGALGLVVIVVLALGFLADKLAHHIPFSVEQKISLPAIESEVTNGEMERYLRSLTQRITRVMGLPEEMTITVHYSDSEMVNAFATLGGHVVMFRGLLEKLPHENALAMVLAHEVAHVKYRHPVRSLGRGVAIGLALAVISSGAGNEVIGNILGETGYVTALKFSRDHEREADEAALLVLEKMYGHVEGADALFHVLEEGNPGKMQYEFFSTHPLSENRIRRIQQRKLEGAASEISQLPEGFKDWLAVEKKNE